MRLTGRWTRLDPLQARDADDLWPHFARAPWVWDYLYEPAPADRRDFARIVEEVAGREVSPAYAVRGQEASDPLGYLTFYTNDLAHGRTEIGNVNFSPALQRTPAATEAFFLMLDWAFGAGGYRRVEWKCNALNAPSRGAAQRLGFSFEGLFRQHLIVKGRNRDTAWLAMTDGDWLCLRPAFADWLSPDNFDAASRQRSSLTSLTAPCLVARDPSLERSD